MQFPRGGILLGLTYLVGCFLVGSRLPLGLLLRPPLALPTPVATRTPAPPPSLPSSTPSPTASTYSGTVSHPLQDSEESLGRCQDQLQALGAELSSRIDKDKGVRLDQLGFTYTCPTSGLSYRWLLQPGHHVLYCSGGSHPGHAVHWDSVTRATSTEWPALPEGDGRTEALLLRLEAAEADEDYARVGELLEALQGSEVDRDFLSLKRADLALSQGDPTGALAALRNLKNGENDPQAQALLIQAHLLQQTFAEAEEVASEILLEDASNPDLRRLQLIALVYEQRWDEADASLEKLSLPYYEAFAHMALGGHARARQAALTTLHEEGWYSERSCIAAILAILNGWKVGDGESMLRSEMAEALQKAPRLWPYPMLRYLNGELYEEELLQLANSPTRRREALLTLSLKALWKDGQDLESQRQRLEEVATDPRCFEGMVAFSLLHPRESKEQP